MKVQHPGGSASDAFATTKGGGGGKQYSETERADVGTSGRLFCRNLPFTATEEELEAYFEKWCEHTLHTPFLAVHGIEFLCVVCVLCPVFVRRSSGGSWRRCISYAYARLKPPKARRTSRWEAASQAPIAQ